MTVASAERDLKECRPRQVGRYVVPHPCRADPNNLASLYVALFGLNCGTRHATMQPHAGRCSQSLRHIAPIPATLSPTIFQTTRHPPQQLNLNTTFDKTLSGLKHQAVRLMLRNREVQSALSCWRTFGTRVRLRRMRVVTDCANWLV
jgi:hypothetical protein